MIQPGHLIAAYRLRHGRSIVYDRPTTATIAFTMGARPMQLTAITANISADFLAPPGVPLWDARKALLVRALADAAPDIVGLQEVTSRQYAYLHTHLPGFTACTVEPVKPTTELIDTWRAKYARFGFDTLPSPYEIVTFVRSDTFICEASGHRWLSPTPERPSLGFGNSAPRVVLWVRVRHRATNHALLIFNTHLDHRCLAPMVAVLQRHVVDFRAEPNTRLLLGDLNLAPEDALFQQLLDDGWQDAFVAPTQGSVSTFLYPDASVPAGRIDHILYQGNAVHPLAWARIESPEPAQRLSDHDPVCVRFSLAHDLLAIKPT
jgi:endonuclease/exonuclease/phosphatase family metal-dependent hydrolase